MNKKNLVLVGPFPEPKGGVSIHMERLSKITEDIGFNVIQIDESPIKKKNIFNVRSYNVFKYFKLIRSADVIHIQSSIYLLRTWHIICSILFNKDFFITIHSYRSKNIFKKYFLKFLLLFAKKNIFVNQDLANLFNADNSIVLEAFIPPLKKELNSLPNEIDKIILEKKRDNFKIITSNAFKLVDHNGEDLYGLDLFLELAKLYKEKKIFFIYCIANTQDELSRKKLKKFRNYIKQKTLDNVLIYTGNISFASLIQKSDATLRLTNTDGDALSIRESLYLNVPAIASDVIDRPNGTVLFKSRNLNDLIKQFEILLVQNFQVLKYDTKNYIEIYTKIYRGE